MRALAVLVASIAVVLVALGPERRKGATLNDLHADAVYVLEQCAGVARVERLVAVDQPTHRIVHIADLHPISLADLAADLRDQDPATTDADVEAEYREVMAGVARVEASQRQLIRWLAMSGVRCIHLEGLTDDDMPAFQAIVRAARNNPDALPSSFGAAGQALLAGELDEVLPAEDESAYRAANPISGEAVAFYGPANDAREAAIVRRLVESGPVSVIVLGGAHDLSRHVRQLGGCEYLKVTRTTSPDTRSTAVTPSA